MFLQIDIISFCSKCKYILIINETRYFHQFLIRKSNREKFIFISHKDQKTFNVVSFDFKNFFSYVQRQSDIMFKPFRSFCRMYMNDIVVFSKIFEKHFKHLAQIFQFFNNKNIMVFSKKSFLAFSSIILFGQRVNNLRMFTTAKKIKTILNLSFPIILKKLNYFLEFIEWLRINIEKYAQLAGSLQAKKTDLIRNINKIHKITAGPVRKTLATRFRLREPFSDELKAFQDIQNAFRKNSFLMHFQHTKFLFIDVNAFKKGGFTIMIYYLKVFSFFFKNPNPKTAFFRIDVESIMFLSKLLNDFETKYWFTEFEMTALV